MSIITADFVARLSGGSANSDGNLSIGGIKSSTAMSATTDALFDAVSAAEAAAGRTEYRCVYLHNANATDTMTNARAWISANTPLAGTTLEIGVAVAGVNATESAIGDETSAPAGVSFTAPTSAGLAMGTLLPGQHRALWLKRIVSPASGSSPSDTFTLGFDCETV